MYKLINNITRSWSLTAILIAVLTVMGPAPAVGETTTWVGDTGSWFDSNWDNGVPTPTTDAFINNGGTAIIASGDSAEAKSLTIADYVSSTGTVTQNGGTLTLYGADVLRLGLTSTASGFYNLLGGSLYTQQVCVGDFGYGEFLQASNTEHQVAQQLTIGQSTGGVGKYTLDGGTLQTGFTMVGYEGTGTFDHKAGTHTTSQLGVGNDSYSLEGGSLITGGLGISNGEFRQKVGTINSVGQWLNISAPVGGQAKYTMNGGTLTTPWEDLNNGTFTQTGGDHSVTDPNRPLFVGGANGPGFFNLEGGTLNSKMLAIGSVGYGEFLQKGEATHNVAIGMGISSPGVGKYTLEGGDLNFAAGTWLQIGIGGTGTFTQTGGDVSFGSSPTTTNNLRVGLNGGTGSYYLQNDATLTMDGIVNVGVTNNGTGGAGSFYQSGGINSITRTTTGGDGGRLLLGNGINTNGYYELSGGQLYVGGKELLGLSAPGQNGGTGTFLQTGGSNTITGETLPDGVGRLVVGWYDNSVGTYTLSGGNFTADRIVLGDTDIGDPVQPLSSGRGTLNITGPGNLVVKELFVGLAAAAGNGGFGKLDLASQDAYVEVFQTFEIGPQGIFTAVPGAVIHMTGTDFIVSSSIPDNLTGLKNLKLIFTGGPGVTDTFELGFEVGSLEIGPNSHVQFVDNFNNSPDENEGLKLDNLVLNPGATIDLGDVGTGNEVINIVNLILKDGATLETAVLDQQDLPYIQYVSVATVITPIPGSLLLLGTGLFGLGALGWRRRRG